MTKERYHQLMSADEDDAKLTNEEMAEGWHWCWEMDGLLANSNEPNGDCFCELNKSRP